MQTKPKKFKSDKEFIQLFADFCDHIVENDFYTIPTQTAFCKYLAQHYRATDRKTIYNYLNKNFPTIKAEFEQLQSDIIAQGAMLNKYNSTMSIFALKNWCKWTDRTDNTNTNNNSGEIVIKVEEM